MVKANTHQIPLAGGTASEGRMNPSTIQGWGPTSVTIQPDSSATTAAIPEIATDLRNHFVEGRSRFRHQTNANQTASRKSRVPTPTMVSKAVCSIVRAGGWFSLGI